MALQYNFLDNNFTIYTPIEQPERQRKYTLPLYDDFEFDFPTARITEEGVPIVEDNRILIDNSIPIHSEIPITSSNEITTPEPTKESIDQTSTKSNNQIKYPENLAELSFEQLVKQLDLPIRVTSGYRPNAKTSGGRASNHSKKDKYGNPLAYDIAPKKGYTFNDLKEIIYKDPIVKEWFRLKNYGVLEEMIQDRKRGFYDVRGVFHGTGATGPHFHIGPDKFGVEWYNSRVVKGQQGFKFPYTIYEPIMQEKEEKASFTLPLYDDMELFDVSNITESGIPIVPKNNPEDYFIRIDNSVNNETPMSETPMKETPIVEDSIPETKPESSNTQTIKFKSKNEWVNKLSEAYRKLGVSENGIKNLIAKNALESGWGKSVQGRYNYGNITTGSSWKGDYVNGKDHDAKGNPVRHKFRSYNSIEEFAADEVNFLTRLYDFDDKDDINTFAKKLQGGNKGKRKYAESPTYISKILKVYDSL